MPPWIDRLAMIGLGCAAMMLGAYQLNAVLAEGAIDELRAILRAEDLPNATIVEAVARVPANADTCRVEPLKHRMRLLLVGANAALAMAEGENDPRPAFVDTALARARQSVVALLSCNPTHAEAWLRLAEIERFSAGFTSEVGDYLARSYRFAPNEVWLARERYRAFAPYLQSGAEVPAQIALIIRLDQSMLDVR